MPSFAIPKFIILLGPRWVSAVFCFCQQVLSNTQTSSIAKPGRNIPPRTRFTALGGSLGPALYDFSSVTLCARPGEQTVRIPIGIAMTPAAMPDGPPSRKGPLCSVLSPLPALYFYCKNTPCPFLSKEIPKTVPLSAAPYTPEPIPKNSSVLHNELFHVLYRICGRCQTNGQHIVTELLCANSPRAVRVSPTPMQRGGF